MTEGEVRADFGFSAAAAGFARWLWPLSLAYGAVIWGKRSAYRWGLVRGDRLPARVISVGNLTVGGTGKTSAVEAVARLLMARGERVGVLGRGYRAGIKRPAVVSDGRQLLLSWREAGDEPYLLASRLPGAAVLIGRDRRETGRMAIEMGCSALLLDDGFQYWRLCRDLDLVLVDALDPLGGGRLLPSGLLRESPRALRRAGRVLVTHADLVSRDRLADVRSQVGRLCPGVPVVETTHRPIRLKELAGHGEQAPDWLAGKAVCALSAIGNPGSFEATLRQLGAREVFPVRFPDHHHFRDQALLGMERDLDGRAELVVTTPKDAVRLESWPGSMPCWVLEVGLEPCQGPLEDLLGEAW